MLCLEAGLTCSVYFSATNHIITLLHAVELLVPTVQPCNIGLFSDYHGFAENLLTSFFFCLMADVGFIVLQRCDYIPVVTLYNPRILHIQLLLFISYVLHFFSLRMFCFLYGDVLSDLSGVTITVVILTLAFRYRCLSLCSFFFTVALQR